MKGNFILFGATGDLARAKILPALAALGVDPLLYGRRESELPNYIRGELNEIHQKLQGKDIAHAYVSLPPVHYEVILRELAQLEVVPRIALEKPFGTSYADAQHLTEVIKELGIQDKVYLVDHYLGKPALIDLLNLSTEERKKKFDENIISHIVINALETNTVAHRGAFYDAVGTIKDFVQNHILAIISTLLMQQGCEVSSTLCRQNVLKQFLYKDGSLKLGQYEGFRETPGVQPDSRTETFVSVTFYYDGLFDIIVNVGKAMHRAQTDAIITYKDGTHAAIQIQSAVNSYEAVIKDFISDQSHFSLSYEEALLCWKITEDLLKAKEHVMPKSYPQGAHPESII